MCRIGFSLYVHELLQVSKTTARGSQILKEQLLPLEGYFSLSCRLYFGKTI